MRLITDPVQDGQKGTVEYQVALPYSVVDHNGRLASKVIYLRFQAIITRLQVLALRSNATGCYTRHSWHSSRLHLSFDVKLRKLQSLSK